MKAELQTALYVVGREYDKDATVVELIDILVRECGFELDPRLTLLEKFNRVVSQFLPRGKKRSHHTEMSTAKEQEQDDDIGVDSDGIRDGNCGFQFGDDGDDDEEEYDGDGEEEEEDVEEQGDHQPPGYCSDQVPCPFTMNLDRTFSDREEEFVCVAQPGDDLDKRQAALQFLYQPGNVYTLVCSPA